MKISINRLTFRMMLYGVDYLLDSSLIKALSSGIKSINGADSYYVNIEFNDGLMIRCWNANKYYGWASSGRITYPDKSTYAWGGCRPKKLTMCKLINALANYKYIIKN